MGKLTPSLAAETQALREATPHSTGTIFRQPSKHLTRRSSGSNWPSIRQAGPIMGSQL